MYMENMFTSKESEDLPPRCLIKTMVQNLSYKLLVYYIQYIIDKNVLNFISLCFKR